MKRRIPKKVIGRMEEVDFPELELKGIQAKIDTGAYTSSIDCKNIEVFEESGIKLVKFQIHHRKRNSKFNRQQLTRPLFKEKIIKNSFGQTEKRYTILTKIVLFEKVYDIELSLADRSLMDYPVLLGRKLLKKGFTVDVTRTRCSAKARLLKHTHENLSTK